jgi:hypothetical protein
MQTSLAQMEFNAAVALGVIKQEDDLEEGEVTSAAQSEATVEAQRVYHLQEARAHAMSSVNIFETTFNSTSAGQLLSIYLFIYFCVSLLLLISSLN